MFLKQCFTYIKFVEQIYDQQYKINNLLLSQVQMAVQTDNLEVNLQIQVKIVHLYLI